MSDIDLNGILKEAIIKSLVQAVQPNLEHSIPRKFFEEYKDILIKTVIEKIDEDLIAAKVADLVVAELTKDDWYHRDRPVNRKRLTELTYQELARRKADEINAAEMEATQ